MEVAFDAYFRAADQDRDGRIISQEAVAFFKGSGLPQPVAFFKGSGLPQPVLAQAVLNETLSLI